MTVKEYNQSVDTHADAVFRFVLKNIKDEDKAKDIVQDTFEKLWIKADSVTFSKVKSYIFTTAYHTMIDYIRKEQKQTVLDEGTSNKHSHERQYSDLSEILQEALELLPDIQKSVILLRDYEGYSYKEIADITELNESQVKVYIFRARKFLKNYIGTIEAVI
jgi:RNA polymerase sigma-70 factor (ECF subfamily)